MVVLYEDFEGALRTIWKSLFHFVLNLLPVCPNWHGDIWRQD